MPDPQGNVNTQLTVEAMQAMSAWQRLIAQTNEYTAAIQRASTISQQAQATQGRSLVNIGTLLKQAAGAFLGISSGVGAVLTFATLLRRELEAIERYRQRAAERQVGTADAERLFIRSLGGDVGLDFVAKAKRQFQEAGVMPLSEWYMAGQAAMSARGSIDLEQTMKDVIATGKYRPELSVEAKRAFVEATLAIQKVWKGTTAEEALGAIQGAEAASRSTSPEMLARYSIPAMAQIATAFPGTDFKYVASIVNAAGQVAEDPTGRRGATNTFNVLRQLLEEGLTRGVVAPGADLKSAIDSLLGTTKEAADLRKFFGGVLSSEEKFVDFFSRNLDEEGRVHLKAEARYMMPMVQMLTDPSRSNRFWQEFRGAQEKQWQLGPESSSKLIAQEAEIQGMVSQQAATLKRATTSLGDAALLAETYGGLSQILKDEDVISARTALGESVFARGAKNLAAWAALGEGDERRQLLLQRRQLVNLGRETFGLSDIAGLVGPSLTGGPLGMVRETLQATPEKMAELRARDEGMAVAVEQLMKTIEKLDASIAILDARSQKITIQGPDGERVPARTGAQEVMQQ